jgi:hypothetical protein
VDGLPWSLWWWCVDGLPWSLFVVWVEAFLVSGELNYSDYLCVRSILSF